MLTEPFQVMAKRATINDVAKAASVGKVTVSYVINGQARQAGISTKTSERILAAARSLDYRPNGVARMLARNRADAIAVVFQHAHFFSVTSAFLNEAMHALCQECVAQELDVMLHTKRANDPLAEANALSDGRVDGVLMLRDDHDPTLAALADRGFPVVLFFSRAIDSRISYVDCDNEMGGKLAAKHLRELGHRRLGMVVGSQNSVDSADRLRGFISENEAAGISIPPSNVVRIEDPTASMGGLTRLLNKADRPTGLFVWSDDVAFECLRAIRDFGLRVPEDISVIGYDGTVAGERLDPPLTTVHQPIAEIAQRATQILAMRIAKSDAPPQQVVFPPKLNIRGTTAPPAKIRSNSKPNRRSTVQRGNI